MISYLCVIQARIGSKRFPNKVMQTVGGKTMVRRVWDAAKGCKWIDKTIVLWPERNPDISEDDLFTPFKRLVDEFHPLNIIRLTADCPLLSSYDIYASIAQYQWMSLNYYHNMRDGYDVQVFTPEFMFSHPNKNHVLDVPYSSGGDSVNTPHDLNKVRARAR